MPQRLTSVRTAVAHLVGPGKIKIINGNLAFASKEQGPLRLDPDQLRRVFCYGDVGVTDRALHLLFQRQIQVAWLSPAGQACRGWLARADDAGATLRILQHQVLAQPALALDGARRLVLAKIDSQIEAARHYQRHGWLTERSFPALLRQVRERAEPVVDLDQLRGAEGQAAQLWFTALGQVLPEPWVFTVRRRRPPPDPINALLSLGYTWLLNRTRTNLEAAGLEVYLGALHAFRPGRPSLACDLMEPWRVPAVDRWVVGLCRRGQVQLGHFEFSAAWGCRLRSAVFPGILHSWEEHWQETGGDTGMEDGVDEFIGWVRSSAGAKVGPPPREEAMGDHD